MTAMPRAVARKRPANAPTTRTAREPKIINGHVVRRDPLGYRLLIIIPFVILAFLFAGLMLSLIQPT